MTNTNARPHEPDIWADYQSVRFAYAWMKAKHRPQGSKAGDSFAHAQCAGLIRTMQMCYSIQVSAS